MSSDGRTTSAHHQPTRWCGAWTWKGADASRAGEQAQLEQQQGSEGSEGGGNVSLDKNRQELSAAEEEISALQAKLADTEREVEGKRAEVDRMRSTITQLKQVLSPQALSSSPSLPLELLFVFFSLRVGACLSVQGRVVAGDLGEWVHVHVCVIIDDGQCLWGGGGEQMLNEEHARVWEYQLGAEAVQEEKEELELKLAALQVQNLVPQESVYRTRCQRGFV